MIRQDVNIKTFQALARHAAIAVKAHLFAQMNGPEEKEGGETLSYLGAISGELVKLTEAIDVSGGR